MKKQVSRAGYRRVLAFNSTKRLVAIFHSLTAAAKSIGVASSTLHLACTGAYISSCEHYFRYLDDNIEVGMDDLNKLRIEEYDDMCGNKRTYYPTTDMSRKGMKYKTHTYTNPQNK